jgi:hypothetical protein
VLAIDFIALLGKYKNELVNSGIVSVLVLFEAQYTLVSKESDLPTLALISFAEPLLAYHNITHINPLPNFL